MKMTAESIRRHAINVGKENPAEFPLNACAIAESLLAMPELKIHARGRATLERWIETTREAVETHGDYIQTGASLYRVTVVNSLLNAGDDGREALKVITAHTPARKLKMGMVIINRITGVADSIHRVEATTCGVTVTFSARSTNRVIYLGAEEVLPVYYP